MGLYRYLCHSQSATTWGYNSRRRLLLVFFGIIHSPMVGIAQGPALMFVYAYLMMSGLFVMKYFLDKGKSIEAQQPETAEKISKSV